MRASEEMRPVTLHIDGVVYQEGDLVVAHALQLDLVVTAATEEAAVNDLVDVCVAQVRYAFENDNLDNLIRSAPNNIWDMWRKASDPPYEKAVNLEPEKTTGGAKHLSFSYAKAL